MKRSYQSLLTEFLGSFPCVSIVGPRQCGKTTILESLPEPWKKYDLEKSADFQLISKDPDLFFRLNPSHVAIDEAQLLPSLFPALRVAIDEQRKKNGRFIITGSSSFHLVRSISESLAGRSATVHMAPLSCAETHQFLDSPLASSLARGDSLEGLKNALAPRMDIAQCHRYWFEGGFPEPWIKEDPVFRQRWSEDYLFQTVQRDVGRLFPNLKVDVFRRFLHLLPGLSGTIVNYADVARALDVSPPTVKDYFTIAHEIFLWRNLPAYVKNPTRRLVKHPKGYFRDTGLLHHFLRIPSLDGLRSHPQMGASWEGLVVEEISRGLHSRGVIYDSYYYRTSGGNEIDLVLEGFFGVVPIEIKYTSTVNHRDLNSLDQFVSERKSPFGLIIHNGDRVEQLSEKIIGVPFVCL
jgi:predicted AAA+ superfamily ATPase